MIRVPKKWGPDPFYRFQTDLLSEKMPSMHLKGTFFK